LIPSHWKEGLVKIDGAAIHYHRTGDGDKPPLVLQHGFSDNGLCWVQTATDLEAQYDVLMPEARGHGQSERVSPGMAVDMAADLAGLIRLLGLQRPVIAGHSMGATIAFNIGVRYPDIPRALILEDPPWRNPVPGTPAETPEEHPLSDLVETIQKTSLEDWTSQTREEHPNWPEWVIQTWCPAKKELDPQILSILNINTTDWQENVSRLDCPTLLFTADPEQGGIVTGEIAEKAREMNHRLAVVHMPDVGHHIRFAAYKTYMEHFRAFLAALD